MGFLKCLARLTSSAVVGTAKVAAKGVAATGKAVYDHRAGIGKVATSVTKAAATTVAVGGYGAYKATAWTAKQLVAHRQEIGGAAVGGAKGMGAAVADTSAHVYACENAVRPLVERIAHQSDEYQQQIKRLYARIDAVPSKVRRRDVLLDSLVVGGNTVASYASFAVKVPTDVEHAYQLAYPDLALQRTFLEEVRFLDTSQIPGLVSGVKGKLFEVEYADYLNDGHLPDGYHAAIADSATQPGWDLAVTGPDGHMRDLIQAKATDSVDYVKEALYRYPHIDVVTTDEVHSQLVMQGFGEHVIGSGISDAALTEMVQGAGDAAAIHFTWMPSAVSLAMIAFSSYSKEGLDAYQKSKNFGERSVRSYLAYLAGGALAVATNTWWLGMVGGMGSRIVMGRGRAKRERFASLKALIRTNEQVLARLRRTHTPR